MNKLSEKQRTEINRLRTMAETDIDTSDIPETAHWEKAVMGKFYRPIKKQALRNSTKANQVRNKHVKP